MITGDQTAVIDFLSSPSTHRVAVANDTHSAVVFPTGLLAKALTASWSAGSCGRGIQTVIVTVC